MVKLKTDPIGVEDLEQYLAEASDFAFELQILRLLSEKGVPCEHSGLYQDPTTKKFREFDIRFRVTRGAITLAAAVECKAIGEHFPLLVSCVPRSPSEAYHEALFYERATEEPEKRLSFPMLNFLEAPPNIRRTDSRLYPANEPVGKSTAQVGRREGKDNELHANDAELFEKWTQALQSLDDLVHEIGDRDYVESIWNGEAHAALALPIVVVPDGRLWSVRYDNEGQREGGPSQVERVSIYIGRAYDNLAPTGSLNVSHLEIMTESGLRQFHDHHLRDKDSMLSLVR